MSAIFGVINWNDQPVSTSDLQRMRRLVEHWPSGGGNWNQVTSEYNYLLERGLMVGRFLRWFEEQG